MGKAMVVATISPNAVTSVIGATNEVTNEVTNAIAGTTAGANMDVIATISGATSAVPVPATNTTGETACRLNTATGSMWSMTGVATVCQPHPAATTGFNPAAIIFWWPLPPASSCSSC